MFEARQTAERDQIAAAGGGLAIRVGARQTADLMQIPVEVARGSGTFYFRGLASRQMTEVIPIAAAGRGHVEFADPLTDQ